MSDVTLSAAVRNNLLALQNTAAMMATAQNQLATGKKVNSALDNPTNYFTASSLDSRANDLTSLLDGVSNGVQTLQAADTGITGITSLVNQLQATARQALQASASYTQKASVSSTAITGLSASNLLAGGTTTATAAEAVGSVTGLTANTTLSSLGFADGDKVTVTTDTGATTYTIGTASTTKVSDLLTGLGGGSAGITATLNGAGALDLKAGNTTDSITVSTTGTGSAADLGLNTTAYAPDSTTTGGLSGLTLDLTPEGATSATTITFGTGDGEVSTLDQLNAALSSLNLQASVSSDGKLSITTTNSAGAESFTIGGTVTDTGNAFDSATVSAPVMGGDGQDARNNFVTQYNSLLSQIDSLAQDSSYNGINLLNSDDLTITMNETGSSTLNIKGVNDSSTGLGLGSLANTDFADSNSINKVLATLNNAVSTLRSQSSQFGSNLSVVQTRQDFTNSLVNVLQTGSANLTTADTNQVSANLLALQTRQQLSTTALSMASQADQNVLRLFQ